MLGNIKSKNSLKKIWDEVQQSEIKSKCFAVKPPRMKGLRESDTKFY